MAAVCFRRLFSTDLPQCSSILLCVFSELHCIIYLRRFYCILISLISKSPFYTGYIQMKINRTFIHGVESSTQQKKQLILLFFICHFAGKITSNNRVYGGASKQSNITNQTKKKENKEEQQRKNNAKNKKQIQITNKNHSQNIKHRQHININYHISDRIECIEINGKMDFRGWW